MRKEEKRENVKKLAEKLARCNIAIATDYRGLSVAQMTELRRKLRQSKVEYRVIKNTLARFAAAEAGKEGFTKIIEGPTAVAFGYGDVAEPAKTLLEHIRATKLELKIRGALLADRVLKPNEVTSLATLPSKEVLVAKLLGELKGNLFALVQVLNATPASLARVLNARIQQLEGGAKS